MKIIFNYKEFSPMIGMIIMNNAAFVSAILFSVALGMLIGVYLKRNGIPFERIKKPASFAFEATILILGFLIGTESSGELGSIGILLGVLSAFLGIFAALMSALTWEIIAKVRRRGK